jgi:hypothetical protein
MSLCLLARTEPFLEKLKYVLVGQQASVVRLDADSFFCREPISLSTTAMHGMSDD